ncbi:MAG: integration/recombination/inversion protein, partial [Firmicutes bacterium]|nr:integration/recombination/inversion protein [Bacillota bacterium]
AVKQRLLSYNPATACSKPKAVKPKINILTVEEVLKILEVASTYIIKKDGSINENLHPGYYPALLVDVYTGLRRSELMGLKWKYVDLDNGVLTIAETLLQTNKEIYQDDDTKTYAGKRTVSIPSEVVEVLRKHKEYVDDKAEYVFCNKKGQCPDPHNFNRFFKSILKKAGITKNVRVHDLRHTNVSMMVLQNVNPKDISKRIGHSNYAFTMQTYAHIFPDTDMKTANKLSELLQKPSEKAEE